MANEFSEKAVTAEDINLALIATAADLVRIAKATHPPRVITGTYQGSIQYRQPDGYRILFGSFQVDYARKLEDRYGVLGNTLPEAAERFPEYLRQVYAAGG